MIVTFIDNKLLLVGGIGRYKEKLNSIDIYNVHTGKNLGRFGDPGFKPCFNTRIMLICDGLSDHYRQTFFEHFVILIYII